MKRTAMILTVLTLCAWGVIGSGCRHRSTSGNVGGASAVEGPGGAVAISEYVIVNNPKLAKGIQIVDLKVGFTDSGLMQANVTLVSKARKTLDLQYRFSWFDANGMAIDPEGQAWSPMQLHGHGSSTLTGTAPNSSAKTYKVTLRKR